MMKQDRNKTLRHRLHRATQLLKRARSLPPPARRAVAGAMRLVYELIKHAEECACRIPKLPWGDLRQVFVQAARVVDVQVQCPYCYQPAPQAEVERLRDYCYGCSWWGHDPRGTECMLSDAERDYLKLGGSWLGIQEDRTRADVQRREAQGGPDMRLSETPKKIRDHYAALPDSGPLHDITASVDEEAVVFTVRLGDGRTDRWAFTGEMGQREWTLCPRGEGTPP